MDKATALAFLLTWALQVGLFVKGMKTMTDATNDLDAITSRLASAVTSVANRFSDLTSKLDNVPPDVSAQIETDVSALKAAGDALDSIGSDSAQPVPQAAVDATAQAEAPAPTDTTQASE